MSSEDFEGSNSDDSASEVITHVDSLESEQDSDHISDGTLEDIQVDELFVNRVKELKKQGYKFALDDYTFDENFDDLIPLVDYIKFD